MVSRSMLGCAEPSCATVLSATVLSATVLSATVLSATVLVATLLVAPQAFAQDDRQERARTLFFEGHEAADADDHAVACAKFAESLALFRRGSTLLNLGRCQSKLGHSASAMRYYTEAAALLEQGDERLAEATSRSAELDAVAPILRTILPQGLPSSVTVSLDGQPLTLGELHAPRRVDAGEHRFDIIAPGYEPNIMNVTLVDGDDKTVTIALGPPIPPPPISAPLPPPMIMPMPPPRAEQPPPLHQIPAWTWVVGSAGLVLAGLSIPFFLDYRSTVNEQLDLCGGSLVECDPDPPGSYDPSADNARRDRDLIAGTALVIAGTGAVVAAVVGAIIGDEADTASPSRAGITVSGDGLSVSF